MERLAKRYTRYGWAKNKGYGTKEHQEAILRHGLTRWHRKQFVETWREKKNKKSPLGIWKAASSVGNRVHNGLSGRLARED